MFDFILNRGNDLSEFFWPILYWTKEQILKNHQIPLWNNLHLAGTPLVSDPQAPIFYPLNVFALIMPIDAFFILSFVLHIALAAVGMYFCSKNAFKFSKRTSVILALLWALTPKFFASLEAGHVGLIYSFAWIPFIALAALTVRPILLGFTLTLLYYSHLPTFLIIGAAIAAILVWKKALIPLAVAGVITFSLTAVSLLPQIEFQKYSTRYLLLQNREVYPKWSSTFEAAKATVVPNMDTEKAIGLGILPGVLAFLGFLKLKKTIKWLYGSIAVMVGLIVLNNASPIYSLLIKQDWYVLLRVSTRFWILIIPLALYLIGSVLEKSKLLYFLAVLGIAESMYWGVAYFKKPINKSPNLAPKEVYEFLSKDKSLFRVYCLTRCISQKDAAIYSLELLDGYSTIQQVNFYKHMWQLTGAYWNYYTLALPPLGADTARPDIKSLGEYNVKYIITTKELKNKDLILKQKIVDYYVYENKLSVPRNYKIYTPNFIRVRVPPIIHNSSFIIPEIYNPNWRAYLNGKEKVPVQETPNALRAVDIKPNTEFVDLRYEPYQITKN